MDGVEHISIQGLDLLEFSEVLVQLGAWQAVVSPAILCMQLTIILFFCYNTRTLMVVEAVFRYTRIW